MSDSIREDSLLFSLKGLQRLERERTDRLKSEREQRLVEQHQRLCVEEQRQRVAERRRAEAEAARVEAERLRRLEEEARLQAMTRAEVERARAEAALRSELAVAAAEQSHQLRLAQIHGDTERRVLRLTTMMSLAVAASVCVASLGLYFGKLAPDHSRQLALHRAEAGAAVTAKSRAEQQLGSVRAELHAEQAESARLKRQRDAAQKLLSQPAEPAPRPSKHVVGAPSDKPSKLAIKPSCSGSDFDPMNGCL